MKILLLAGEESGMLYARQLETLLKGQEIRGYADYGFETADLAVFGFAAVLKKLFFFIRVKRTMQKAIREWKPDVVCTVDYPGLNLQLAAYAKHRGIRTVHVVSPQVWAWKKGRIPVIEASVDRLCCFFPFEPALYRPGLACFTGHPLAKAEGFVRVSRPAGAPPLVALLPGSRKGEVMKIFPTLLEAARRLAERYPTAEFIVPAANDMAFDAIDALVKKAGLGEKVMVVNGGARELLAKADCAAVASGTATLEAALARCPTVLVYRVSAALAVFARIVIRGTKYIGLANVVWDRCKIGGEQPMPELLQGEFTADSLAEALGALVASKEARTEYSARLEKVSAALATEKDPMAIIAGEVMGNDIKENK